MPKTKIDVSPVAELQLLGVVKGTATYKEFYSGWETGVVIEAPAQSNEQEITAIYRKQIASPVGAK